MAQTRRGRRTAGSIRRLPSGRYQARVRGDDGLLRAAPGTFATKAEADRWLAAMITDQAHGRWVDPRAGKVMLREFAGQWLAGKAELAPKTTELYEYLLSRLILHARLDAEREAHLEVLRTAPPDLRASLHQARAEARRAARLVHTAAADLEGAEARLGGFGPLVGLRRRADSSATGPNEPWPTPPSGWSGPTPRAAKPTSGW